jgi:glycosyl hydrolase family 18 (putative chitinase)
VLQALVALPFSLLRYRDAKAAGTTPRALGYLPWWMAAGWQAMPLKQLDRVVLFDAPVQRGGTLLERNWAAQGLIAHAKDIGLKLDLALTLLNESEFNALFGDAAARSRLLSNCLRALDAPHVAGLHLDIEGYAAASPNAVRGFREWLLMLDDARRRAGKGLSAFFPASDSFSVYDGTGATRMDYWVAQLYDAHWPESKVTGPLVTRVPGNPVAVPRALARLTGLGIPRELIMLSVPLYGWQWSSEGEHPGAAARGRAKLLSYAETPKELMPNDRLAAAELAQQHGLRRDGEHTPYYAHRDGDHWVQGWYEDFPSLTRKLAPERGRRYAGLAFFPLGYDKGEVVEAMLRWWRPPQS